MISTPNHRVLAAITRLNAHEDFQVFLRFLEDELTESDTHNRELLNERLYRSQGKSLTLDAILSLAKDASKRLSAKR